MGPCRRWVFGLAATVIVLAGCGQVSTSVDDTTGLTTLATTEPAWSVEAAVPYDSMSSPAATALAIGSDGTLHVAYAHYRLTLDGGWWLRYVAKDPEAGWSDPEDVAAISSLITVTIAVDGSNVPHVAYVDTDGNVQYRSRTGAAAWSDPEQVTGSAKSGFSIMVDGDGAVHVGYRGAGDDVWNATRAGAGDWSSTLLVDAPAVPGTFLIDASVALDPSGVPHAAYTSYAPYTYPPTLSLGYDGSSQLFSDTGSILFRLSLAFDPAGDPHIAYIEASGDLMYTTQESGTWTTPAVIYAGTDARVQMPVLVVDGDGVPHVTIVIGDKPADVYYATPGDAAWTVELVDAGLVNTNYPAGLAVDASGHPHVTYGDEVGKRVMHAALEGSAVDSTPPVVTPSVVPAAPDGTAGWYVSTVSVTWSVTDEESEITSTTGCAETVIDDDTVGTTVTCSATSTGGTETQSVLVMRDATNPTVTVTGVSDGMTYLQGSVPTAGCSTSDGMSGIALAATLSVEGGPTGPITASCVGALDNAGNGGSASATYTVLDPAAAIQDLVADIEQLVADGVVKMGQARGLIRPLENALRSLDKDRLDDALNQLADFIVEVEAKVPPLTEAQASELIAGARAIIDILDPE